MCSFDQDATFQSERNWLPKESSFEEDMKEYWGDWGVASEVETLRAVLMRRPGKEIDDFDAVKSRFSEEPIDAILFRKQHDDLARLYREHGVTVHLIETQREDRPNAVYCRDTFFMTPEGAIIGRPGMAARRGEERYVVEALGRLGVPILRTVAGDGIFEGANAMWVDRRTVILGTSSRTNKEGFDQVASELRRIGVQEILHIQIPYSNIHIDGLLNFASTDVAMLHAAQVPYDIVDALSRKGIHILEAPSLQEVRQTLGCNFVALEPGVVVQPEGNPRSREVLERAGIRVIPIDVSEILKGRGAIHCVTAFLKRG